MVKYKNPFYSPKNLGSQPEYGGVPVEEYCGFLIFERIKGVLFDVVLDGEIKCMRAGLNGAKSFCAMYALMPLIENELRK